MTAALAIGAALGVEPIVVAEMLPEIEAIVVRSMNRKTTESGSGAFAGDLNG